MQINPANLASPGKSSSTPGRNGNEANSLSGHDGLNGLKESQARRNGGNDYQNADGAHAFGSALHDAMHGPEAGPQDSTPPRPQPANNALAATPAVPAHVAGQARDDEEAPATDAQMDGGLQAFVNSLQTPVTAMTVPTTASAAASADVMTAAAAAEAGSASTTDTDGVAALAADAAGKGKAYAFGLDDGHGAGARAKKDAALDGDNKVDAANAADAAGQDKTKVNARDAHASLRAQEVAASKVAPEFRAALNDAQASRPGLQETLNDSGSGSLAQAMAASANGTPSATSANAAASPQAGHVAPPLHASQWQDAFGQQVVWMAKNEQQIASLTMNPPDLGPVRVTLSVSDGQASAAFVSLQPEVRQAIQDAVPRLKEMLADAGLQLQQASVDSGDAGREAASRARGEDGTRRTRSAGPAGDADESAMSTDAASLRTARSIAASRLVDLFA